MFWWDHSISIIEDIHSFTCSKVKFGCLGVFTPSGRTPLRKDARNWNVTTTKNAQYVKSSSFTWIIREGHADQCDPSHTFKRVRILVPVQIGWRVIHNVPISPPINKAHSSNFYLNRILITNYLLEIRKKNWLKTCIQIYNCRMVLNRKHYWTTKWMTTSLLGRQRSSPWKSAKQFVGTPNNVSNHFTFGMNR